MSVSRYFSLTTYATDKQIKKILRNHLSSIRSAGYIYHDKDEAEPHHHILLRMYSTWTASQIKRWFDGLKDDKKEYVNTFCEIANDIDALKEYILHKDKESIEAGKYMYDEKDIVGYAYHDISERKDSCDNCLEIIDKIIMGENPRNLVKYYGRAYVYHWAHFHDLANEIRTYEGYKEAVVRSRINNASFETISDIEELEHNENNKNS